MTAPNSIYFFQPQRGFHFGHSVYHFFTGLFAVVSLWKFQVSLFKFQITFFSFKSVLFGLDNLNETAFYILVTETVSTEGYTRRV